MAAVFVAIASFVAFNARSTGVVSQLWVFGAVSFLPLKDQDRTDHSDLGRRPLARGTNSATRLGTGLHQGSSVWREHETFYAGGFTQTCTFHRNDDLEALAIQRFEKQPPCRRLQLSAHHSSSRALLL